VITSSKMAGLWRKLRNKKFRDAFVASQFKRSIPFQIVAMRKKLGWSQGELARAAKLTQGVISRAENPDYGNLTFNTVLRAAAGLDVAVIIEFVPFSRLLQVFENRSEDEAPVTFEQEDEVMSHASEREEPDIALPESILQGEPQHATFGLGAGEASRDELSNIPRFNQAARARLLPELSYCRS
jgi:transcriptional regulator with XRE-family HTH domain